MQDYREIIDNLQKLSQIKVSEKLRSRFEDLLIPSITASKVLPSSFWPFRIALGVFVLIVITGGGVFLGAEKSQVGDPLYTVKRALENVEVVLTFDSNEKAIVHIEQAGKRIEEIKQNVTDSNGGEIEQLTNRYGESIEAAVENVEKSEEKNDSIKSTVVQELTTGSERLGQIRVEAPSPALPAINHAIEASDKAKSELIGHPEGMPPAKVEEESESKNEKVPVNPKGLEGKPNPGLEIKDK